MLPFGFWSVCCKTHPQIIIIIIIIKTFRVNFIFYTDTENV